MTTPRTPRSLNIAPEILGWTGHPDLLSRLGFFSKLSLVEGFAVGLALYFTEANLPHQFGQGLMPVTLAVILVRFVWATYAFWGFRSMTGADINTVIHGMRRVPTSRGLSCFAGFFLSSSIFLMAWHTIIALLIFEASEEHKVAVNGIGIMFFLLAVSHYLIWSKSGGLFSPTEKQYIDPRMPRLRQMYKKSEIALCKYSAVASENPDVSSLCCVCLENFSDKDEVAKLPCGHVFHPLCPHLWIRKHWDCPLRCDLTLSAEPRKLAGSSSLVTTMHNGVAAEVDLEIGNDLRALGRAASTPTVAAEVRDGPTVEAFGFAWSTPTVAPRADDGVATEV